MANLLNGNETPNLLELVESYHNDLSLLSGLSETATCDEKTDVISASGRTGGRNANVPGLPRSLIDLSLCSDEADDGLQASPTDLSLRPGDIQSVYADETPPPGPSVCADEEPSDIRLKTDIEQVGTTVYGLPLYHFRYKAGAERFEGVMAQDVLEVMPDAVVVGENGYYRVKYGQLGIMMTRA